MLSLSIYIIFECIMYKSAIGPTTPCSTAQHIVQTLIDNHMKATQLMAGRGTATDDTNHFFYIFRLPLLLPYLYKLYPSQSLPFYYHPTESIRLSYQSSISPFSIFFLPNTCISLENGRNLPLPHFNIPYTGYLLS